MPQPNNQRERELGGPRCFLAEPAMVGRDGPSRGLRDTLHHDFARPRPPLRMDDDRRKALSASGKPNSPACLIELVMSLPPLASPAILARELCACSRKGAKSAVPLAATG